MQQRTVIEIVAALVIFVAAAAFVSGWNPFQQKADSSQSERVASAGDRVSVFYVGKLDDGTIFDTNDEATAKSAGIYSQQLRQYAPFEFILGAGRVIVGFDRAVTGMKVNETKRVRIPPEEAYGDKGPLAGKALTFDIRLVNIITG